MSPCSHLLSHIPLKLSYLTLYHLSVKTYSLRRYFSCLLYPILFLLLGVKFYHFENSSLLELLLKWWQKALKRKNFVQNISLFHLRVLDFWALSALKSNEVFVQLLLTFSNSKIRLYVYSLSNIFAVLLFKLFSKYFFISARLN
jgi:hypothetical protein